MPEMKYLIYELQDEKIAWIKFNRPSKMNALGMPVILEFRQILEEIKKNKSIRIMVITSATDGMFTAGADVKELSKLTRDEAENLAEEAKKLFKELTLLDIPVVAAVNGLCLTAGLELSVSCDLIVASDNAQFGQIEPSFGLTTAAGATQRLTQLIGALKTRELLYTAKIINAEEALKIGLINNIIPIGGFKEGVVEFCNQIIKNSPRAIKDVKRLINNAIYENQSNFDEETKTWGAGYEPEKPGGFIPEVRDRFGKMLND